MILLKTLGTHPNLCFYWYKADKQGHLFVEHIGDKLTKCFLLICAHYLRAIKTFPATTESELLYTFQQYSTSSYVKVIFPRTQFWLTAPTDLDSTH